MRAKTHTCKNCGRRRLSKFMYQHIALSHGVDVRELYPKLKHGRVKYECGDCEENLKR